MLWVLFIEIISSNSCIEIRQIKEVWNLLIPVLSNCSYLSQLGVLQTSLLENLKKQNLYCLHSRCSLLILEVCTSQNVYCYSFLFVGFDFLCFQVYISEKSSAPVAEQCAWAIGNVAGEGEDMRNVLLSQGALPPLARMIFPDKGSTVRTAAWALSNLIKV